MIDLQHHLFMLTFGTLHIAPLPSSLHNVLDIGTGTGLWAIEFGMKELPAEFQSQSIPPFHDQFLGEKLTVNFYTAQDYPMAKVIGSDLSPIQPELYSSSPPSSIL